MHHLTRHRERTNERRNGRRRHEKTYVCLIQRRTGWLIHDEQTRTCSTPTEGKENDFITDGRLKLLLLCSTTNDDDDETARGSRFSGVECVFIVRQRRGLRREWTSGELFMYVSTSSCDDDDDESSSAHGNIHFGLVSFRNDDADPGATIYRRY